MRALARIVATSCALLLAGVGSIQAEVIGPLLPRKVIEMGMMVRDTDRMLVYEENDIRFTQTDVPFTIRYGISSTATLSLELNGNPFNFDEVAIFYTVGASIQALVWRQSGYAMTVSASYTRTLAIDEGESEQTFYEQSLYWTFLGQRAFDVRKQELSVWLGPLVSYMSVTPQAPAEEHYTESQNLLGGVVGLGFLLVDHIILQGQIMWIDDAEYRATLAYRF